MTETMLQTIPILPAPGKARIMEVVDPFGNRLCFSEDTSRV